MGIFLVFGGDSYYPGGGWHDYLGCYPTEELARAAAAASGKDWWHIVQGGRILVRSRQ